MRRPFENSIIPANMHEARRPKAQMIPPIIVGERLPTRHEIEMEHEKSCGAVIFRIGNSMKYLLLHYEAGHWDFVKGHVEKQESEEETVRREILEETGLKNNRFVSDFRERISYFYRRRGGTVSKEVVFYLVEALGEEPVKISGEHIGYEWLPYREAFERLTYKNAKDMLRKAESRLRHKRSVMVSPLLDPQTKSPDKE